MNGIKIRGYSGSEDRLAKVISVSPAFLEGFLVTTDGVFNGSNLVVTGEGPTGNPLYLLVCEDGWLYLRPTKRDERGKPMSTYTAEVAANLGNVRLSLGDRKRIVGAVLKHFMGTPDWERMEAYEAELRRRRARY